MMGLPRILAALVLLALRVPALTAADSAGYDPAGARAALAAAQDQVAAGRRALGERLTALAQAAAARAAELRTLNAQLAVPQPADPRPQRVELARYAAGLAGAPAATPLADSLRRWREAATAQLAAATALTVRPGQVTWWDGHQAIATVTRLGAAGAAITGPAALVAPFGDGWRQVGPAIPGPARAGWIPVDVTGRLAAQTAAAPRTLWRRLADGGWFVIPILATGLIAALLVLERLISFHRERGDDGLGRAVVASVAAGDLAAAQRLLVGQGTPAACVLGAGLAVFTRGFEARAAALGEAILAQTPRIERSLTVLGMLAAIAPLLGLLGTVSGMISMFQVLSAHGTGNPKLLSGGISEALITTQLGLLVAVPVLFAHALLARRAERALTRIEEQATALASSHAAPASASGRAAVAGGEAAHAR